MLVLTNDKFRLCMPVPFAQRLLLEGVALLFLCCKFLLMAIGELGLQVRQPAGSRIVFDPGMLGSHFVDCMVDRGGRQKALEASIARALRVEAPLFEGCVWLECCSFR